MKTLSERAAAARAIMLEIFMDEDDECIPEASFNDPIKAIYTLKTTRCMSNRPLKRTLSTIVTINDRQRRLRASLGIVDDLGKKWTI